MAQFSTGMIFNDEQHNSHYRLKPKSMIKPINTTNRPLNVETPPNEAAAQH